MTAPSASWPSVVRPRVSVDASAWKLLPSNAMTVRQTPLMAMLSPICTFSNGRVPTSKVKRTSPPRVSRAARRPTPSMIPVNK
ncbi:hypothetical protein D3C85_1810680 [compost metagenome]